MVTKTGTEGEGYLPTENGEKKFSTGREKQEGRKKAQQSFLFCKKRSSFKEGKRIKLEKTKR